MKTTEELEFFFRDRVPALLRSIDPEAAPLWGKMNVQQMIEHLALALHASNGKVKVSLSQDAERADKWKRVGLLSDRPLAREFKNPLLPEEPIPCRNASPEEAIVALENSLKLFFDHFAQHGAEHLETHNMFGALNYPEWLWFHFKHFRHHLEQFGVTDNSLQ